MKKNLLWGFILCCFFITNVKAQLSNKDKEEIRALARKKIQKSLPELMNTLNLDDVGEAERKNVMLNSYLPSTDQLFFNDGVIVEDDLNPDRNPTDKPIDANIGKYFNNYDLFYQKSATATFEVSNVVVAEVKETNEQIYVQVFYRSVFKGKHKKKPTPYQAQERVAEFKAEKIDKKWEVLITRIAFHIPEKETVTQAVTANEEEKSVLKKEEPIIKSETTIDSVDKKVAVSSEKKEVKVATSMDSVKTNEPQKGEVTKVEIPQPEKPVVEPTVEQKPIIATPTPKNIATLEALETELASYKSKRTIFKVLSIGALATAGAIFVISNGKYSDYTAKVDKNNDAYSSWYKSVYNSTPPNSELAQPISSGEYTSPSILPMAGAAVVGIGLFLWGGKYGRLARETQGQLDNLQKRTSFVPRINILSGEVGASISYKF